MMEEYIQISMTTESSEDAEKIAKSLLEKRLTGCVQIVGPITSIYWWNGNIENSQEWLCLVKSREDLYKKLEKAIKQIHPYQTPEIVATPIVTGSIEYLKWLSDELEEK